MNSSSKQLLIKCLSYYKSIDQLFQLYCDIPPSPEGQEDIFCILSCMVLLSYLVIYQHSQCLGMNYLLDLALRKLTSLLQLHSCNQDEDYKCGAELCVPAVQLRKGKCNSWKPHSQTINFLIDSCRRSVFIIKKADNYHNYAQPKIWTLKTRNKGLSPQYHYACKLQLG